MTDETLLPPNATAMERAMSSATSRLGTVDVPIDRLWSPANCPAALLPWLAMALSVDVWRPTWPEHVQRAVIGAAIDVHRRKGTIGAVRRAVAALGVESAITEWFESGGTPCTFDVAALAHESLAKGISFDGDGQRDLLAAIEAAKNVRSHFDMTLRADYGAGLGLAAGMSAAGRAKADTAVSARDRVSGGLGLGAAITAAGRAKADAAVGARDRVSGGLGLAAAIAGAGVGKAHAPLAGRNGVAGGIGLAAAHHPVNFVNVNVEVA